MTSHDYIIVGGGAAGCVLAARLSEDPGAQVLLLEAGPHRRSPLLQVPLAEVRWMGDPKYDWCYQTEQDPTIGDRRVVIPGGRLLGGSNAINGMVFVRGQREDYDGWAAAGNTGWSWDSVLPFFRRLERVHGDYGQTRGTLGPIDVGAPDEPDELCEAFLAAAAEAGYPSNPDYNSGDQAGFGYYQFMIRRGRRASAVAGYLEQARRRPNLTVQTGARVTKLQLQGTRCVGVRYRVQNQDHEATCRREVILSAGTIQSPKLLELSGIGPVDVLARVGIPVVADLPGVGENFRDHYAARLRWRVRHPITLNERTRGRRLAGEVLQYAIARRGVLSRPIALGFGFVPARPDGTRPDLQFHFAAASYGPGPNRVLDSKPGMTVGVYPLRPESRGSVHLRSADPTAAPVISPRFLDAEADQASLVAGMRIARRIVAGAALAQHRDVELVPGPDVRSDDELLAFAREAGDTSYHPVGTCRMGTDPLAVVDPRLRVRGVQGLRVIDASVMPTLVSGNTNAATFMIAEKGAEMVLADHAAGMSRTTAQPTFAEG
jgi:choline dehydrogenase-like flavoprotein